VFFWIDVNFSRPEGAKQISKGRAKLSTIIHESEKDNNTILKSRERGNHEKHERHEEGRKKLMRHDAFRAFSVDEEVNEIGWTKIITQSKHALEDRPATFLQIADTN